MNIVFMLSLCIVPVQADARAARPCDERLFQTLSSERTDVRIGGVLGLSGCVATGARAAGELARMLQDPEEDVRRYATISLQALGPETGQAIEALAQALGDRRLEVSARVALVRIGLAAVPALLEVLRGGALEGEDRPERWHNATIVLRDIGPAVVPLLIGGLSGNDNEAHGVAATLAMIGPSGRAAIPHLIGCLKRSRDSLIRERAAAALSAMTPLPAEAVGPLVLTLEDRWARAQAAKALGSMGPEAASGIPALERALERARLDGDKDGERLLLEALGKIRLER